MKMTVEALGKMSHFIGALPPQAIKEVLAEMNLESLLGFIHSARVVVRELSLVSMALCAEMQQL